MVAYLKRSNQCIKQKAAEQRFMKRTKQMTGANLWQETIISNLHPKLKLGFAHCGGMLVIGILKKGNSWLFNTSCAQNKLAVNHPTVFYHIGEGSLSHIFVFYTRWQQTNTIPYFWEIQSPVEAKYTKRSVPQFPADGGCCFGFAPKFLTELSASKCENRPAQKIDTHRSTLLNFSPSHPIPLVMYFVFQRIVHMTWYVT